MLALFSSPEAWIALLTLTVLEVILGIDNLVFISIITSRLPSHRQKSARQMGLLLACISRLLLLAAITWLTRFTHPLFTLFGQGFSARDLILIAGGLFLLAKATSEIHVDVAGNESQAKLSRSAKFTVIVIQVMFLDIIFSLDSVNYSRGLGTRIYSDGLSNYYCDSNDGLGQYPLESIHSSISHGQNVGFKFLNPRRGGVDRGWF